MTRLFIWDEAPMMHKFAFEAVDRTFRDITQVDKPFGGKIFVFGGFSSNSTCDSTCNPC
jgi:hypothetical protein